MTDSIYKDFILAQSEMKNAELNRINPHFKSKYADLTSVRDATLPALNKNGFCIIQSPTSDDSGFSLITKIIHESGEVLSQSNYPLSSGLTPQKLGSELTYAKRYAWASICGICADEDDDGNNAIASIQKVQWKGPLKITELKNVLRGLSEELNKISIKDTEQFLEGLWTDNKSALVQATADLPQWYDGAVKAKAKALEKINTFPGDIPMDNDPFNQSPLESGVT